MSTIEVGIDLGTTNSSVAVVRNQDVQIVKNVLGEECTPSVVYADRNGTLLVGSKAKRKLLEEATGGAALNGKIEIKRLMGTNETLSFPQHGKALAPESLSAEILKSLRNDVLRKFPEINLDSAIITVPAHFSTVQSESTKRAGQLAGFSQVVLLQEPIAAAIAYGFLNKQNENWLVYDLGGGTFDVALVAYRDGGLTVLAHNGDNFLGGKDIDALVVEQCFVPFLESKGVKLNIEHDKPTYQQLKSLAEQAKIELSSDATTTVDINLTIAGKPVRHDLEISREDLMRAAERVFQRTTRLCEKTIADSKVTPKSITKLVLVGGPTQMPVLQSYLERQLGVRIDNSLDPLTVVAKGAALFGMQVTKVKVHPSNGHHTSTSATSDSSAACQAELNYKPVVSDDAQTLTGKITPLGSAGAQLHTVCIQSEDGAYSSGDILLRNGKFICEIPTGNKGNQFWIYVKSASGDLLKATPDSFSVNRGVAISGAPIPHSVGVAILALSAKDGFTHAEESMDFFFQKNSILPLSETKRYVTVRDVKVGQNDNALPIRVYEGESVIPDRNDPICEIALTGTMVPQDIPKASPVDITITINESRELSVSAHLPTIDLTVNARATIYEAAQEVAQIQKTFSEQVSRAEQLQAAPTDSTNEVKQRIADIKGALSRSEVDSDQKRKAAKQVRELMSTLDEVEAMSKFETILATYNEQAKEIEDYLPTAEPADKRTEYTAEFALLTREGTDAIAARNGITLQQVISKMKRFHMQKQFHDYKFLLGMFNYIQIQNKHRMGEPEYASIVKECEQAITDDNVDNLSASVLKLLAIAHTEAADAFRNIKAGITR